MLKTHFHAVILPSGIAELEAVAYRQNHTHCLEHHAFLQ